MPIRVWIEGFLRGRYGYEGHRALWMLAVPVLLGTILVAGWLLLGSLTIPRFSTAGPVVRNGVAAVMVCGEKRGTGGHGLKGLVAATAYAPEPRTGAWWPEKKGECTVWYHRPPIRASAFIATFARGRKAVRQALIGTSSRGHAGARYKTSTEN